MRRPIRASFPARAPALARQPALVRGFTIYEALISLAIGAFGLLAVARVGLGMQAAADLARQTNEAATIAEGQLDQLRAYQQLPAATSTGIAAGQWGYGNVTTGTQTVNGANAVYTVSWTVAPTSAQGKPVSISVSWAGRRGTTRSINLNTMIAGVNPASELALAVTPAGTPIRDPMGRSLNVPVPAVDLGDGTSAFTPPGADPTLHLVFNNVTGVLTKSCSGTGSAPSGWTCTNTNAFLVSGFIAIDSKDKNAAVNSPWAISFALTKGSLPANACYNDSQLSSQIYSGYVTYTCIVNPDSTLTPPSWSGTMTLSGVAIGTASTANTVCRYSGDYNGNGVIDNDEHPATYTNVTESLQNQNFYVVAAGTACPAGTVQLQP